MNVKAIGKVLYANRAGIAMTVCLASGVAALIDGCIKSTKNTPTIIKEHKDAVDTMKCDFVDKEKMTKNEKKEYDKQLCGIYRHTAFRMCKNYGLTIGFAGISVGSGIYGYKVKKKECANLAKAVTSLSAMYTGLYDKFENYRENIRETYGEEADFKAMQNVKEKEVKTSNGKTKKVSSQNYLEDVYFIFDSSWDAFDRWNHKYNINELNRRMRFVQSDKLDNNAVAGITLDEIVTSFGCKETRREKLPYEWTLLGYLPGDQIEYEVEYDTEYAFQFIEGSGSARVPAPPIKVTFKDVSLVASKINPGDKTAIMLEDCYAGAMYNRQMEAEEAVERALM